MIFKIGCHYFRQKRNLNASLVLIAGSFQVRHYLCIRQRSGKIKADLWQTENVEVLKG